MDTFAWVLCGIFWVCAAAYAIGKLTEKRNAASRAFYSAQLAEAAKKQQAEEAAREEAHQRYLAKLNAPSPRFAGVPLKSPPKEPKPHPWDLL